jgi:hypothetical protein
MAVNIIASRKFHYFLDTLVLLAQGEMNGLTLAERLNVSPPTITHHAAKLREAALIHERREKNTIYFSLNDYFLRENARAVLDMIYKDAPDGEVKRDMEDKNAKLRESVLRNFYTGDGKLKHIPAQYKKKLIVLENMVGKLEKGRKYSEKEVNEFIKQFHEDFATIRREFIMHQYMYRENEIYELNPQEMWTSWENVK